MNYFDSLSHAMTTISTGGFSNYDQSIGYFNNPKMKLSLLFLFYWEVFHLFLISNLFLVIKK